jgi:transcriptional regulator with XRE-family HTH domain
MLKRLPKLPRLRAIRIARALSQAELGERSGVSRVAITRLERGDVDARFATIRRLAQALDVEPADLMAADVSAA